MNKDDEIFYGEKLEVFTFSGWEEFDWDMYESDEEACEAISDFSQEHIRRVEDNEK